MATRIEVGSLTDRLRTISGELHSELVEGDADFGRLGELSRELSKRAESLAETFARADDVLAGALGGGSSDD